MEVVFWWVLLGWFSLHLGLVRRDSNSYNSQRSVVPILPEATADKFQVPAKHLLSSTSTGLVLTQKVYLFMYSSSFCSCQGMKWNFSPWRRCKSKVGLQIILFWVKKEDKAGSCFLKVVYKTLKTKGRNVERRQKIIE